MGFKVEVVFESAPESTLSGNREPVCQMEKVFEVLLGDVVPAALVLLSPPCNGDVRVLVSVCMRRMLPSLFGVVAEAYPNDLFNAVVNCISINEDSSNNSSSRAATSCGVTFIDSAIRTAIELISYIPDLLGDRSPIPQYIVRLLADCLLASHAICMLVVDELCRQIYSASSRTQNHPVRTVTRILPVRYEGCALVSLLERILPPSSLESYSDPKSQRPLASSDSELQSGGDIESDADVIAPVMDPQVAVLVRLLIDRTSYTSIASYVSSLSTLPKYNKKIIASYNDVEQSGSFLSCLVEAKLSYVLTESILRCIEMFRTDSLSVLLDLLQSFVSQFIGGKDRQVIDHMLSYTTPMLPVLSALVNSIAGLSYVNAFKNSAIFSAIDARKWNEFSERFSVHSENTSSDDPNALHLLQDSCVSCVSLLADVSTAYFLQALLVSKRPPVIIGAAHPPPLMDSLANTISSHQV